MSVITDSTLWSDATTPFIEHSNASNFTFSDFDSMAYMHIGGTAVIHVPCTSSTVMGKSLGNDNGQVAILTSEMIDVDNMNRDQAFALFHEYGHRHTAGEIRVNPSDVIHSEGMADRTAIEKMKEFGFTRHDVEEAIFNIQCSAANSLAGMKTIARETGKVSKVNLYRINEYIYMTRFELAYELVDCIFNNK